MSATMIASALASGRAALPLQLTHRARDGPVRRRRPVELHRVAFDHDVGDTADAIILQFTLDAPGDRFRVLVAVALRAAGKHAAARVPRIASDAAARRHEGQLGDERLAVVLLELTAPRPDDRVVGPGGNGHE